MEIPSDVFRYENDQLSAAGVPLAEPRPGRPKGDPGPELLALDRALGALETLDARQARIVELRFFGGLGIDETAEVVGVSSATVKREWRTARAWLRREIGSPPP